MNERDMLMYRDEHKRWWNTEATAYQVGDQGELTLWREMDDVGDVANWQFIECIPGGYWSGVRSTNEMSQATRRAEGT